MESSLNQTREVLKGEDKSALEKALANLNKARLKLGESIYKATGGSSDGTAGGPEAGPAGGQASSTGDESGKKPDDVIDAEYEVK